MYLKWNSSKISEIKMITMTTTVAVAGEKEKDNKLHCVTHTQEYEKESEQLFSTGK